MKNREKERRRGEKRGELDEASLRKAFRAKWMWVATTFLKWVIFSSYQHLFVDVIWLLKLERRESLERFGSRK